MNDTFRKPKSRSGLAGMLLCAAVIFGILAGCENPLEPPESSVPAGYGAVSIAFTSGTARTVLPAKVFANYGYTFTKADGSPSITRTSSGETFTQNLEYGEWTVDVKAYAGAAEPANLAAEGTETFTVNAGAVTIPVTLTGFSETGAGTFKYKIRYPAGATRREFSMKKLPDLTSSVPLNPTSASSGGTAEISQTVSGVSAGFYLVTILLEKDGRSAGRNEVVHIYRNLTSEFGAENAPAVFRAEDFTADSSDAGALLLNGPALRVVQGSSGQLAVSWDEVAQAQGYQLFISTVNDPARATQTGDTITATSRLIFGLANGTPYYLWASSISATGVIGPKGPFATGTPRAPDRPPESNPTLRSTANQGNIRLSWDGVPAAESYKLYASNSASVFSSIPTAVVEALSYNCTAISSVSLQSDTPYFFKVIASNSFGDCPDAPAAQTVRTLADEALSPGIWTAEKNIQIGDILRFRATAEPGKTYTVLSDNTVTLSPTSFSNAASDNEVRIITLTSSNARRVKIVYYDPDGTPQISPAITSVSPLPSKLELSWGAVTGATGYNVYRGDTPTSMTQLNSDPVVSPYSDTGISEGRRYYYQVSAVNGSGEGPRSAAVAGTAFRDSQALLLTDQIWADGEITAVGATDWYKIQGVTSSTIYYLWFNTGITSNGDATKTLSSYTNYTIYSAAGDVLSSGNSVSSFTSPKTYTAFVSGTLYLRLTSTRTGTYGIVYSTTPSSRPAVRTTLPSSSFIQPLTDGVWTDDEQNSPGEIKWYSIAATARETYRLWINKSNSSYNQGNFGDGTKTMVSAPNFYTAVYTADGLLHSVHDIATSNTWTNPINVFSPVTGVLYLKIRGAVDNAQTGTYGIAYSTSTVRPATGTFQLPVHASISEGLWTDGSFPSDGGGAQYFRFTITAPGDYYVHFNSALTVTIYAMVYDANGYEMGTPSIISSSPKRRLVTVTTPGDYFVAIYTQVSGTGIASRPYRVTYNGSTAAPALP